MSFALYTDCGSNLPGYILKQLDIRLLPGTYVLDGKSISYSGDIEQFDAKAFYDEMRADKTITTSLINTQQFSDHFRTALEEGLDVVYVGMSSGISGTYQAACIAAEDLMAEFPGRTVRCVDSRGAGLGTGILTCRGADLRAEGKDANAAADTLEEERLRLCEFFTVGNLHYLHRSGRISSATAALGTVLNIKPLLYGDYEGHIVPCGKYRGRKKVVDAIVDRYAKKVVDAGNNRVAISHGDCLEEAQDLAHRICQIAQPKELIICPHEPFTGSHVGPEMLALFFFGDSR